MKDPSGYHRYEYKLKARHKAKNCPICNSHKLIAVNHEYRYAKSTTNEWVVCCKQCDYSSDCYFSMDEAIHAWNEIN